MQLSLLHLLLELLFTFTSRKQQAQLSYRDHTVISAEILSTAAQLCQKKSHLKGLQ